MIFDNDITISIHVWLVHKDQAILNMLIAVSSFGEGLRWVHLTVLAEAAFKLSYAGFDPGFYKSLI